MKTKVLILIAVFACLMLTACGSTDIISGYSSGDVKLGQYKEVTYEGDDVTVTDDEVKTYVQSNLVTKNQVNIDIEGKTVVENGDTVICKYTGYMDGVQFEGGTSEESEIIIGKGSMIPGFEEGFIGAEIGVEKEINVTFPDPYDPNPSLAGKPATFKILVNRIVTKGYPEYNDELVQKYTEFETMADYEYDVRSNLLTEKETRAEAKKKYEVFKKIIGASEFDDQAMAPYIIENRERLITDSNSMYSQVLNVDAFTYYNQYMGMSIDDTNEYFDALAKMQTEYIFVLAAVAEKEDVQYTDAEIDELADKMKDSYKFETVDQLYESLNKNYEKPGKEVVASQLRLNKALDLIMESALDLNA